MKRNLIAHGLALLAVSCLASAADIVVKPSGENANIDTRLALETIGILKGPKSDARTEAIRKITSAPENYAPPVLYLLSSVLFAEENKDDAMFWFYAGQLRARIDANICADKSARQAVAVLNQQFGSPINQYAFKDIPKLTSTVEKVLKWEETTECKYDRRWINLHGMGAFTNDPTAVQSAPKQEWEAIRSKTRDEYRSGFNEAVKSMKQK